MTPGLACGPPFPTQAVKGAIVTIAGLDHASVPKAVGECEIDISALKSVIGAKGHAIKCLHWHGDEIWNWNQHDRPGLPPPDEISSWLGVQSSNTKVGDMQTGASNLDIDDDEEEDGGVPISSFEEVPELAPLKEWTTSGMAIHIFDLLLKVSRARLDVQKSFLVLHLASS